MYNLAYLHSCQHTPLRWNRPENFAGGEGESEITISPTPPPEKSNIQKGSGVTGWKTPPNSKLHRTQRTTGSDTTQTTTVESKKRDWCDRCDW